MEEVLVLERTLTELDHVRLSNLVHRQKSAGLNGNKSLLIEQVLDAADIVPWSQVAANVGTMHSRILVKDLHSAQQSTLTMCYPLDANPGEGYVSVFSPAGGNLLGRKVGDTVTWLTPDGKPGGVDILGILFQPESSGDFTK